MKIPEKPPNINKLGSVFGIPASIKSRDAVLAANDEYLSWEEMHHKYASSYSSERLKLTWQLVRSLRYASAQKLNPFDDEKMQFSLSVSVSNKIQQNLHELDMCTGEIQGKLIPQNEREAYVLSSLMEEAIASSQLEGATTSRKVAKEMLRAKRKPKNKHELMILNNYNTMKKIVNELKGKPLSTEIIKDIHKSVTKATLENESYEGEFRNNNDVKVWDKESGEVLHTPPSYEKLPHFMQSYCDFANSSEPYLHPIVKASILHFLIGYLHPFEDGNGRTARAIFYWYLLSKGYWLFEFLAISRIIKNAPAQYARAYIYSEQDDNDLTYFVKFQIEKIGLALGDLKEYVKRKTEERKAAFDFIKLSGINERQAHILSIFQNDPTRIMAISEVQDLFSVVYQTARTDMLGLEKIGFLTRKVVGKKMLFLRSQDFDSLAAKQ